MIVFSIWALHHETVTGVQWKYAAGAPVQCSWRKGQNLSDGFSSHWVDESCRRPVQDDGVDCAERLKEDRLLWVAMSVAKLAVLLILRHVALGQNFMSHCLILVLETKQHTKTYYIYTHTRPSHECVFNLLTKLKVWIDKRKTATHLGTDFQRRRLIAVRLLLSFFLGFPSSL